MVDGTETNGEWLGDSAQQAVAEGGEHEGLGAAAPTAVDGGTDAVGGEGAVKSRRSLAYMGAGVATGVRGFSQRTERKRGKR